MKDPVTSILIRFRDASRTVFTISPQKLTWNVRFHCPRSRRRPRTSRVRRAGVRGRPRPQLRLHGAGMRTRTSAHLAGFGVWGYADVPVRNLRLHGAGMRTRTSAHLAGSASAGARISRSALASLPGPRPHSMTTSSETALHGPATPSAFAERARIAYVPGRLLNQRNDVLRARSSERSSSRIPSCSRSTS